MKLDSIAAKLQNDGVGIKGQSIFIGNMPANAIPAILLKPPALGTEINPELPGYRKTHFNAVTRGKTYADGEKLMERVMASLTLMETTLPGMDIRYIRPQTEPISFPISNSTIFEFLVIFEATYVIVN